MRIGLGFVAAFLSYTLSADIVQIKEMKEILPSVGFETLVIFDIDNTLLRPAQTLGSDQWFEAHVHTKAKQLGSKMHKDAAVQKATKEAIVDWVAIQRVTQVELLEPTVPEMIKKLQDGGTKVMALTARPANLANTTITQLKSLGIDMGRRPVYPSSMEIEATVPGNYQSGIVFIGPLNNKGDILVRFLKRVGSLPKKIVFADDKQKHVDSVERSLKVIGIPYMGFRYGAADEWVKAYDPAIAGVQWASFGKILSDEQARVLSQTATPPGAE